MDPLVSKKIPAGALDLMSGKKNSDLGDVGAAASSIKHALQTKTLSPSPSSPPKKLCHVSGVISNSNSNSQSRDRTPKSRQRIPLNSAKL